MEGCGVQHELRIGEVRRPYGEGQIEGLDRYSPGGTVHVETGIQGVDSGIDAGVAILVVDHSAERAGYAGVDAVEGFDCKVVEFSRPILTVVVRGSDGDTELDLTGHGHGVIDGELLSGRVLDDGTVGVVGDDRLERGGDLHILGGHGEGVFSVLRSDGGSVDLDGLDLVPICRSNGQNDLVAEVGNGLVCSDGSVLDVSDHDLVFSHLERRRNGDILGRHGEGVDPFLGSDGGSVELDSVDLVSLVGGDFQLDLLVVVRGSLAGDLSVGQGAVGYIVVDDLERGGDLDILGRHVEGVDSVNRGYGNIVVLHRRGLVSRIGGHCQSDFLSGDSGFRTGYIAVLEGSVGYLMGCGRHCGELGLYSRVSPWHHEFACSGFGVVFYIYLAVVHGQRDQIGESEVLLEGEHNLVACDSSGRIVFDFYGTVSNLSRYSEAVGPGANIRTTAQHEFDLIDSLVRYFIHCYDES